MRQNLFHALAAISALALASCETLQPGAPPVTPAMTRMAEADGWSAQILAGGRRLLAMRCTSCHSLEPIAKYSAVEWRTNVSKMADRAGLNETEIREITCYLVAARQTLGQSD